MSIADLQSYIFEIQKEISQERERHNKAIGNLENELYAASQKYMLILTKHDLEKIKIAESVIHVKGEYIQSGDQDSVVDDFIKWVATGESVPYGDPTYYVLGTKNYGRFYSQRSDYEYGYSPRHGTINFSISLQPDYRNEDTQLSDTERDAVIYYLKNLKDIQKTKGGICG